MACGAGRRGKRLGCIDLDPVFSYLGLKLAVLRSIGREKAKLKDVNHFAAETEPFPSTCLPASTLTPGQEGLADVRVVGDRGSRGVRRTAAVTR
jgi:hypothetical protein